MLLSYSNNEPEAYLVANYAKKCGKAKLINN